MTIDLGEIKVIVLEKSAHIHDSYRIKGRLRKLSFILAAREKFDGAFGDRTIASLLNEWTAHNVLYRMGVMRERTAHVDFEFKQGAFHRFCYWLISAIGRE